MKKSNVLRSILLLLALSVPGVLLGGVPAPWLDQDIGPVAAAGSANSTNGNSFSVAGSGVDIFGAADEFHYGYQKCTGNFTLTARLTREGGANVNPGALAGLMVRESTAANSRHAMIYAEPAGFRRTLIRNANGGQTTRHGVGSGAFAQWLRVIRYGDLVHLASSPDGTHWTEADVAVFPDLAAAVCVGMAVSSRVSGGLNTAAFDQVTLTGVTITTPTSWLGNTWPGGGRCVGFGVASIYVDPATGMMYANGQSENYSTAIYDANGGFIAPCANSHFNGGSAITGDANYVYAAQSPLTKGTKGAGVAIYDHAGVSASPTILLSGHTILGLACDRQRSELYIADSTANPNVVHVFSTASRTETRQFRVDRARNLALAPDGTLWIIQEGDAGGNAPKVLHYDKTGSLLSGAISGVASPRGIAISSAGLIYVTDTGPDQNVKIFDATGAPQGTFGALGGIYSGTKGAVAANKFNFPVGVGLDDAGHIWVACNGPKTPWADLAGGTGAELRKFTLADGALQWERFGLEYVDCASADPGTDGVDVYTKHNHYVMDYSKPTGGEWTRQGMTVDPVAYPSDPRLSQKLGPSIVRRIKGNPYLYVTDQQGGWLHMYRFQPGSEIAIPTGSFRRETHRGAADNRLGIWHDTNGNGAVDTDEMDTGSAAAGAPSNENYAFSVDKNGGVWTNDGANIRCYSPQVDAAGHAYYSSAKMNSWPYPAAFAGPQATLVRVCYDADKDEMYLAGYTADAPKPDKAFGSIGTRIVKYRAFKTSRVPAEVYRIAVPRDVATKTSARAMDVAGGFVAFVLAITGEVDLYHADTGALAAKLPTGPETGPSGWVDCNNGVQLFARSNGELLVFVEEDNEAKVIMRRYKP